MKVIVFNVEHGACAFLRTPTNHAVLIDCGCTEKFSPTLYLAVNELPTATRWKNYQLTSLTITHPHDDHIEDIDTVTSYCEPAILYRQTYDWEEVKTAEEGDYSNLESYSEWQEKYSAPLTEQPNCGMDIRRFWLSPADAKKVDESKYINNSSMITVATVQGTQYKAKFLFGGDMETAGWDALLNKDANFKEAVKNVNFFIISHHGHCSGFSQSLFNAMQKPPIFNIVSIHHNDDNIDPRYSQEAYASGGQLNGETRRSITTRTDGTITILIADEGTYSITTQHLGDNRRAKAAKRGY
jgi:beta-lactamase superfamily II metal-dependent hydrolase